MSYFRVESLGTFGSSDIFGSADQPANEATIFHGVRSFELRLQTACGIEKVRYRCLTMNLYSFVSITRPKFLSTWQKVVPREFWRFLTLCEAFISTLRLKLWNRLFGGNSGCVYPLAFFHKALRILHYCRRGNSGFQHADKSIRAIFDQSEHFKLTHVCSAIALFLFVGILHFDY